MDTHRVRRLRWQARAPGPAEAFALRSLLREHGDECLAALDRAFESVAPRDEVWHLPRLELKVELADLERDSARGLAERVEAAVRAALVDAVRAPEGAADGIGAGATHADAAAGASRPNAGAASRHPAVAEGRQALRHYLATGLLPWTLAGLAPELAQRVLCEAAAQVTESVLNGADTPDALLPGAGGAARVGALLRWLGLLPAALRRRWVFACAAPLRLDAAMLDAWRDWIDDDAHDRIEWQALWLAGPIDIAELRARVVTKDAAATGVEPPFLPALRLALARAAHGSTTGPNVPRNTAGATPASGRSEAAAPIEPALAPSTRTLPAEAAAGSESAAPESLLVPLAGLVLLHPWLARLLGGCGVLDTAGKQIAPAHFPRACALLHGLACGDAAEPAEHQLPFVKLLLGRAPDEPLTAELPALSAADHEEITALLNALREHWSALRGTAIDGLRLSFLQRRGLLSRGDGAWQLRMQVESFDLLLGMLPWSIGLVRLPWMAAPLVVEWPTP